MTWLTWRQFRAQTVVTLAALALLALYPGRGRGTALTHGVLGGQNLALVADSRPRPR